MDNQKLLTALMFSLLVLSFITVTPAFATSTTRKTLDSGDSYIHGSLYFNGSLWFSTVTSPAKILKMNATTLDYSKITLNASLNEAYDIVYAEGYIWTVTKTSPTHLIRINPNTLAWQDVLTITGLASGQCIEYSVGYHKLWVGGISNLSRIDPTTLAYDVYDYSATVGTDHFHSLESYATTLYATANYNGHILKIDPANPTSYSNVSIGVTITDDITFLNNYLYIGTEEGANTHIYKFGSDLSTNTSAQIGTASCYGVFSHDDKIWAVFNDEPGIMREINSDLQVKTTVTLPSGYDKANEIVEDESQNVFITCWMSPARVVKYKTFTFHGVYNEATGELGTGSASATGYFDVEITPQQFEVNGTVNFLFEVTPLYLDYNLGGDRHRQYWFSEEEDTRQLYVFNATLTRYTISFLDLAGVLTSHSYVEAQCFINGVLMTVEKRKVDVENKIMMSLVNGIKYTLSLQNGASHTFGDLLMTSITTIQLTLKGIAFSKETLLTYKYVRIYGNRDFDTPNGTITITYQDTLNMTASVTIYIKYKNGTNVYNHTEYTNSFNHEWANAMNDTDYAVVCTIDHATYGVYSWKQYFPLHLSTMPWSLDWLGKSLPFNTAYIIPAFLILFVGGCFSTINAEVGAFMLVITAIVIAYMGWLPIPATALVTAFTFTVLMGIIYAKHKVQT